MLIEAAGHHQSHPLSLHDALPISEGDTNAFEEAANGEERGLVGKEEKDGRGRGERWRGTGSLQRRERSEEHTSELQSPCKLVCRLLLATKKTAKWALTAAGCTAKR